VLKISQLQLSNLHCWK